MRLHIIESAFAAGIILTMTGAMAPGEENPRPTCIERYGIGGHIQAIGLHHGFHIETVAVDSPAAKDRFKANDVIVKVDNEEIRSLDQLRAVLAEAFVEDGAMTITYTRGSSLEQRVAKCQVKPAIKKRPAEPEETATTDDKPVPKSRREDQTSRLDDQGTSKRKSNWRKDSDVKEVSNDKP